MVPNPIPAAPIPAQGPSILAETLAAPSLAVAGESGQACGFAACLAAVTEPATGSAGHMPPKKNSIEASEVLALDQAQILTPIPPPPVAALPPSLHTSTIPVDGAAAGSADDTPGGTPSDVRMPSPSDVLGGHAQPMTAPHASSPLPAAPPALADPSAQRLQDGPHPIMAHASPSGPPPDRIGTVSPAAASSPEPHAPNPGAGARDIMPAAPLLPASERAPGFGDVASPAAVAEIAAASPPREPAPGGGPAPGTPPAPHLSPSPSVAHPAAADIAASPDRGPDRAPDTAIALGEDASADTAETQNGPRTAEPSTGAPVQPGAMSELPRPRPIAAAPAMDAQRQGGGDGSVPNPPPLVGTEPPVPEMAEGHSDPGLTVPGAGTSTSLDLAVGQAPASTRAARLAAHPATGQVFVALARGARDGIDRIAIKLQPPELGRVDILMELGEDGRVQAVLAAERPATVEILQRDLRDLERALQRAGLAPEPGGLSVALRQNGQGGSQNAPHHGGAAPNAAPQSASGGSATTEAPPPSPQAGRGTGRLDIRV